MNDDSPQLYVPSAWGQLFHSLPYNEALGGGSAGGGKTMCLLMEPMQQIIVEHERCRDPGHPFHQPWGSSSGHAIFLRRTHPMLADVVKRAHRLFRAIDPSVKWNENKYTFTFKSGYVYQFGHCHDKNDWQNYLGFEFSIILWDELVTFEEEQYDQVNSRLRSFDPVLRKMLKIRAMSNPMMQKKQGENFSVTDVNWVRRRFVDPEPRGRKVLVRKIRMDDGSVERWTSIFLPALLSDNPDAEFRRQYEIGLQQKKPHIRQALLRGDWYATEGSYHSEEWNPALHICKPFDVPKEWPKWRSMDWGFKLPGCVHWWAMDEDGNVFCVDEMKFQGQTDEEVAERIIQKEVSLGWSTAKRSKLTGPADTQLWEQRGDTSKTKAQAMADKGVYWVKADKRSRLHNAELLTKRLLDHHDGTATPGVVFFDRCQLIIQMIPSIQTSDKNSEEPADGSDDHPYDSCVVAGTLVDTPGGPLPIEQLIAGDQVLSTDGSYWTSFGGRLTRRNAEVWKVTYEGGELIATPDHRMLCTDGQWRRIDELDTSLYAFAPWKTQKSSPKQPSCSVERDTTYVESTTSATGSDYTGPSGKPTTVPFQRAITYTTLTRTERTTPSLTYDSWLAGSMSAITCLSGQSRQCVPMLQKFAPWRRLGTLLQKVWNGIVGTLRSPSVSPGRGFLVPAESAAESSSIKAVPLGSGARRPVLRDTGEHPALTTWREFALPAGVSSWRANTVVRPPAHGSARKLLSIEPFGRADVYCTTVPIMGAFVANGIVVSNCLYSMAYASNGRAGLGWVEKDEEEEKREERKNRGRWGYGSGIC